MMGAVKRREFTAAAAAAEEEPVDDDEEALPSRASSVRAVSAALSSSPLVSRMTITYSWWALPSKVHGPASSNAPSEWPSASQEETLGSPPRECKIRRRMRSGALG